MEKGGRLLVDIVLEDVDKDWPDTIPGGWTSNSQNYWDGVSRHEYDEFGALVTNAYTVIEPVDEAAYLAHLPDQENGDPAVYHRVHVIFGHNPILV